VRLGELRDLSEGLDSLLGFFQPEPRKLHRRKSQVEEYLEMRTEEVFMILGYLEHRHQ
jgi:hypothetical protein